MKKGLLFTILLLFIRMAESQTWQPLGAAAGYPAGGINFTSIAIGSNNTPYASLIETSGKASVMKYNGTNWVLVGSAGFSAGTVSQLSIAIDPSGTPYVAYVDAANNNRATVMKYNGSAWVGVGPPGFTPTSVYAMTPLAIDHYGQPWLGYTDGGIVGGNGYILKFDGGSLWKPFGGIYEGTGFDNEDGYQFNNIVFDLDNTLYLAYAEYVYPQGVTSYVDQIIGTNSTQVFAEGYGDEGTQFSNTVADNLGDIYTGVATTTQNNYRNFEGEVYDIYNGTATALAANNFTYYYNNSYTFNSGLGILAADATGDAYMMYSDRGTGGRTSVVEYYNNDWITVGNTGFDTASTAFASDGNNTIYEVGSVSWGYRFVPQLNAPTLGIPGLNLYDVYYDLCAAQPLPVSIIVNGTFNASNIFTVQISDQSGSFENPVNIGSIAAVGDTSLTAFVPGNLPADPYNDEYRVRIVSSNPATTGPDDGVDINLFPQLFVNAGGPNITISGCNPATNSVVLGGYPAETESYGEVVSYQWSPTLDLDSSMVAHPTLTGLTHDTTYVFTVSIETFNAFCVVSDSVRVHVATNNVAAVTIQDTTGSPCFSGNVFVAAPANGGPLPQYNWKLNSQVYPGTSPVFNASGAVGGDTVICTMISNSGCVTKDTAKSNSIILGAIPVPSVSIVGLTGDTICAANGFNYTATPVNGGSAPTYVWYLDGSVVQSGAYNQYIEYGETSAGNHQIYCYMTSNDPCVPSVQGLTAAVKSNVVNFTALASIDPFITISSNDTGNICSGTSITFTADAGNVTAPVTYQWTVNGNTVQNNASSVYTNSSFNNDDNVQCTMYSTAGCPYQYSTPSNTVIMSVAGALVPSVTITGNGVDTVCANSSVQFAATAVNAGPSPVYNWKVNGTSVQNGSSSTYSNSTLQSGSVVTCVMTSGFSCATPASVTSNSVVAVSSITPHLNINVPGPLCTGAIDVTLTAVSSAGGASSNYNWAIKGVSVQNGTSPTYTSNSFTNNDSISCTMTSILTCAQPASVTARTVLQMPSTTNATVSITSNVNGTACLGTTYNFTAAATNVGTSPEIEWYVNGYDPDPTSTTLSYTTSSLQNGDEVFVEVFPRYNCPGATSNGIIAYLQYELPSAVSISDAPSLTACSGTPIQFTATNSHQYNADTPAYIWYVNGSPVQNSNAITYTSGSLQNNNVVSCGMISSLWCALPDTAASNNITVSVKPVAAVSLNASICQGSSYSFNGKGLTATGTYADTLNNGSGCDSIVTLHLTVNANDTTSLNAAICSGSTYPFFGTNESQSGTYTHALQSSAGCDSLIILHLTVNNKPVSAVAPGGPVTLCAGTTVTLDAGAGFTSYLWNTGATSETLKVAMPGSYYCTITANGCQGVSDTVIVSSSNLTAAFTYAVSGDTARFNNTSTGATTYSWNFGDNTTSNLQSPTHVYSTGGSFKVILTTTSGSCTAADTQTVQTGCLTPVLTANISGPLGVCLSVNTAYSIAPTANATSYTWLVPAYCTLLAGQGTDNVTVRFLTGFHTGEIGVHATGCGGNSSERLIFVTNSSSAPSEIVGPTSAVCGGSTKTYSTPKVSGVTSYTWTVTGANLLSGQGTDSIQVEFPSNYTSVTISVQTVGNCGSSTAKTVTITSTPIALTLTGSPTGYCKQATPVTLSVVPVAGATSYTWTVPAGITIDNGQGTHSITVTIDSNTFISGDVTVYATNGCGNSPTKTLLISAAPAKPASIVGPPLLTAGDTYTDSVKPIPFASSYTWAVPAGWIVTGPTNTNKIMYTPDSVSGNITVTANNECGSSPVLSTHYSVLKDGSIMPNATDGLGDIKVFPNPFSDRFEVQFEATENMNIHIRVYTVEGQLFTEQIQQTVTGTNQFYIDMNMAAPGIYIVSAIAGGETKVMRVLKQ